MIHFRIYFNSTFFIKYGTCFFILFLFAGCAGEDTQKDTSSQYFDSILHKADSLYVPLLEEDAVNFIDSAYGSFANPGVIDLYNKYDFKRNYFFSYKKDYHKALLYTDSMLNLLTEKERSEYVEYYGRALFWKGNILFTMREYDGAFKCYYEGRKVIESIQDTCLLSEYSNSLGLVAYTQGKYHEAATYFKQSFNEYAHCGTENSFQKYANQQGQLDNIGLCYDKLGKSDSAIQYYSSALAYILKDQHKYSYKRDYIEMAKGIIYGNIGTVCYKTGDWKKAEDFFKQSIQINARKGYANEDAMITNNKLIALYLDQDRLIEAKIELEKVKISLDSVPSIDIELRWNKLQSDYYAKNKDPEQAYIYLNRYVALKDSIDKKDYSSVAFDFNREFESLESRYQLEFLKKRDELKTVYLVMISSFVIMLAIMLLLFWLNAVRTRKRNNELQTAVTFLEKSQADNARILKIVAHDLRSPLGGIAAIIGLMLDKKEELNEDQEQLLNLANTSATQSLQLIDDLLNLNATTKEMKKEPTDMQELLDQCVDLLQFRANEKNQDIKLKTEKVFCNVDKEKIWRVISNLITNSIKFSNEGSDIMVQLIHKEKQAIISVQDKGIGIPPAFKGKIFNMSEEIKRSGTGGEKSFGLGLSISKQIMDAHQGKIWYESEQGKETTFYLQLPAIKQSESRE